MFKNEVSGHGTIKKLCTDAVVSIDGHRVIFERNYIK
jgi:hypothetical protein